MFAANQKKYIMTPKEKAIYIKEEFTFNCKECDNSKISALIAANEMIKLLNDYADYWDKKQSEWYKDSLKHIQEIKQEIQNL